MAAKAAFYGGAGWLCVWGGGAVRKKTSSLPKSDKTLFSERKPINQMCESVGAPFTKGADTPMPTLISASLQQLCHFKAVKF